MKIGLSTSVIQRGRTGIAEYIFSLVRALEPHASEHQFTLFVLEQDLPLFEFAKKFALMVTVPEAFRSPMRDIFWHQTILPELVHKSGLDVLHVPSYRRLIWRKPCALTATVHDLAQFHIANKYDWKRMFYGRTIARRFAERQDEIIAISRNTARDLNRFWKIPDNKITVIHNGVDHERFFPAESGSAKETVIRRFGQQQPFFLYIARIEHPAKNHLRLIKAFELFKAEAKSNWQLVLAGSDWHGSETVHALIRQSPFAADIRCLGFVSEADIPSLYRAADVFVYPSLYEGFGFPPLEAMACGCPVLCSTRGALAEIVGNAAAIADPEDIVSLKLQLANLAADGGLRIRQRLAGLKHVQQFNWQRTAVKTLDIYARAFLRKKSKSLWSGNNPNIHLPLSSCK